MHLKKLAWLTLSCLVVLALALTLASCGNATTTTTTTPTTVKGTTVTPTSTPTSTPTTTKTTTTTTASNTPKYGGTMSFLEPTDIRSFDDVNPWICYCWSIMLTNDSIFQGNWVDGPAGSGKMSWLLSGGFEGMPQWMTAGLAPTWEASATDNSMTLHLRQGVHFFNKAPVNGREMTADDVVYSIKRQWTIPTAFLKNTYPAPTSVVKVDKYTVKVTWGSFADMTNDIMQVGGLVEVWPHEVFDTYGNAQDWRNSNGTGPFMITDYVKNSSATFVKNPDYYLTDPLGPGKGNKLPYVDGIKMLIIPDISDRKSVV